MLDQASQSRCFRIGLFVLIGVGLLVGFMLMVVGDDWLHRIIAVESYVDESVQGLTAGSPVKYRGVTVGQVKKIGFIGDYYHKAVAKGDVAMARYVYIQMIFRTMSFIGNGTSSVKDRLQRSVKHGLRVHLAPEGLTGKAYLDLDFVEADAPVLAVAWKPALLYIPSRPSTMSAVISSVSDFFDGMKDVDFQSIFKNASHAASSLRESLDQINHILMVHQDNINRTIDNMGHLTQDLRLVLESMSVSPRGFVGTQPLLHEGG